MYEKVSCIHRICDVVRFSAFFSVKKITNHQSTLLYVTVTNNTLDVYFFFLVSNLQK